MTRLLQATDDYLVEAYAKGNNEAFDVLLRRHQNKLYSYIFKVVKNEDVANDIFQDSFVKAIMTIKQGRYAATGKFAAWISRIAHNLIIDHFRQEKSENQQSADIENVDIFNKKELSDGTIEDFMIEQQTLDNVRELIARLPEQQQEVLQLRFYKDLSFKEIAELTNVSINTALGRMRYALINLRRLAKESEALSPA